VKVLAAPAAVAIAESVDAADGGATAEPAAKKPRAKSPPRPRRKKTEAADAG
jgi:hypothetical protein